jgi:hypothetical protein
MKNFSRSLYGVFTACALALSAGAQTNLLNPPVMPPAFPTNVIAQGLPATPPAFPTNLIAQELGLSAVGTFALNLLPGWDRTATNSFAAHELELEVSPTWKTGGGFGQHALSVHWRGLFFYAALWRGHGSDHVRERQRFQ